MLAVPIDLLGQTRDSSGVAKPGFCWSPRALPRCGSFAITEVAFTAPLATTRTDRHPVYGYGSYEDFGRALRWSAGFMWNTSARHAQGVTVATTASDGSGFAPSIEWRNRFWKGASRSYLDLSAGYARKDVFIRPAGGDGHGYSVTGHGVTATAAVAPIDLIGVLARADAVFTRGRAHYGLSVGAQTGSYGGMVVTAAIAAYVGLLIAALAGGDF